MPYMTEKSAFSRRNIPGEISFFWTPTLITETTFPGYMTVKDNFFLTCSIFLKSGYGDSIASSNFPITTSAIEIQEIWVKLALNGILELDILVTEMYI